MLPITKGLYAIVDLDALRARAVDVRGYAASLLRAKPPILQLRAKSASARETLALLDELVPLCRAAGTLLFANDRPDLAVLAGADGVHVGQDDLPVAAVRRIDPALRVGTSTHNFDQLERALAERPDYVAFGPIFATSSKQRPDPVVGLERLRVASERARAAGIPLVAIGGIDLARASDVAAHGAIAAVIGALIAEDLDGVTARAKAFMAALG